MMSSNNVLLPDPFGPVRSTVSPRAMEKVMGVRHARRLTKSRTATASPEIFFDLRTNFIHPFPLFQNGNQI